MKRFRLSRGKHGFSLWRYCFTARESRGNEEVSFVLELNAVNPLLSPEKCEYSLLRRTFHSKDDFERDEGVRKSILDDEILTEPSYVAVRLVMLGRNAKEYTVFVPYKEVKLENKGQDCVLPFSYFGVNHLRGKLVCEKERSAEWDLKFEIENGQNKGFRGTAEEWIPFGVKSVFSGVLKVDGKDYAVQSSRSFGYIDYCFVRGERENYFHLSSSNLISLITRKVLPSSFFIVHGIHNGRLSFLLNIEGRKLNFFADQIFNRYNTSQDCVPMPNSDKDDRVHWTASLHNGKYVIDVDVFCKESDMFMRVLEDTSSVKNVRKLFSSHSGRGELKVYRSIKKSLELLEHVKIDGALCEYGKIQSAQTFS